MESAPRTMSADALYGTWRLVSFTTEEVSSGRTEEAFGKAPGGFINYGCDGRMFVLMVKQGRPNPVDPVTMTDQERAELFRTMISYGGTYTLEGTTITHHIDVSWNQNWTGTDQVRNARIEDHMLILATNPQVSPIDGKVGIGVLTWEKVE